MAHAVQTKLKFSLSHLPAIFKRAFAHLIHNDPLRMAGATAFFTSFALPFILILLTQFMGLVLDPLKIRHSLFRDLSGIVGEQSVRQVVDTLIAFRQLAHNVWITAFGFLFLLMVATTMLMVIKSSINQLWRIKVVEGRSVAKQLRTRLQSVLIILATGVLILVSILAEAAKAQMGKSIAAVFPALALYINSVFNYVLSLLFVTLWFGVLFRLLPDARPSWKVAFSGAFVTAILFTAGKYVLRLLLINSNISNLYGASASVVLVLLFVFYSSLILYFGASFTHVWSAYLHEPVKPLPYASRYEVREIKES
ncbi:YihY/virulence factor BrkB family protein [Flavisolibacter ginsenosidimutans]|uniref:YihY/virulence factor BrkB family protein n=1 Tax=Flavisolibacter ginsenosidimutans TaxID=661481 RepID=A0A5B8UPC2_9BACT|nr:YihY/virulence factor BrkB family protein [Flavisolibacter ginsenosidimutans]QEC58202.1 YihY/virulence factor BrkB family protein [Flavisolibacter ginsenosidimutans]